MIEKDILTKLWFSAVIYTLLCIDGYTLGMLLFPALVHSGL